MTNHDLAIYNHSCHARLLRLCETFWRHVFPRINTLKRIQMALLASPWFCTADQNLTVRSSQCQKPHHPSCRPQSAKMNNYYNDVPMMCLQVYHWSSLLFKMFELGLPPGGSQGHGDVDSSYLNPNPTFGEKGSSNEPPNQLQQDHDQLQFLLCLPSHVRCSEGVARPFRLVGWRSSSRCQAGRGCNVPACRAPISTPKSRVASSAHTFCAWGWSRPRHISGFPKRRGNRQHWTLSWRSQGTRSECVMRSCSTAISSAQNGDNISGMILSHVWSEW